MSTTISKNRRLILNSLLVIALLIVFAFLNISLTPNGTPANRMTPWLFAGIGSTIAQATMIGLWCGLVDKPLIIRIPVTCALISLECMTVAIGTRSNLSGQIPGEIIATLFVLLFQVIALAIAFTFLQHACRMRISITARDNNHRNQMSIKYLLVFTTIVAILTVAYMWLVRTSTFSMERDSSHYWALLGWAAVGGPIYAALTSPILCNAIWILNAKNSVWSIRAMRWAFLCITLQCILIASIAVSFGNQFAVYSTFGYVYVSYLLTTTMILFLFRAMGYRLRRYDNRDLNVVVSDCAPNNELSLETTRQERVLNRCL